MTPDAIRPARPADRAAIEALVDEAYRPYVARIGREPGPMRDDYAARIAAGHVTVLERERRIVGLLVLIPQADAMLLDNIAVAAGACGAGFGARLMRHAEATARAAGLMTLRLYTNAAMTENLALYARTGWRETHRIVESGFNRVYMEKTLGG